VLVSGSLLAHGLINPTMDKSMFIMIGAIGLKGSVASFFLMKKKTDLLYCLRS
jgi:hypothetical protein